MAGYVRRAYSGAPVKTTITSTITASDLTISLVSATGWPTGAPFYVVIDEGLATEEKAKCTRSGTTLTIASVGDRGVDGTAAAGHQSGASIRPCLTALDLDEANAVASVLTTKGDMPVHTGSLWARQAVGANSTFLTADSSLANGVKWFGPLTITLPYTWAVPGLVSLASGDTDYICPMFVSAPSGDKWTCKIVKVRARINSGTSVTMKMQAAGADVTGFTGISVTTTTGNTTPTGVSLSDGDALVPVVTATSGSPKNMTVTAYLTYTFFG